ARPPVEEVEPRIVRAGDPGGRAAALPRVAFPRLIALLAFAGNRVEPPGATPRVGLVRVDEAADSVLAAGDADDHLVLHDERRAREAVALVRVGRSDIPADTAGLRVEAHHVRVERAHEQPIAERAEAAVLRTAAQRHLLWQRALVVPERPAGSRINGVGVILR